LNAQLWNYFYPLLSPTDAHYVIFEVIGRSILSSSIVIKVITTYVIKEMNERVRRKRDRNLFEIQSRVNDKEQKKEGERESTSREQVT
jgi:hypothetical protein